jgi:hypothetical protein
MAAGSPIPTTAQIALSSTPGLIAAANINRKRISVVGMTAAVDFYIGASSTMTSTTGFPVLARTSYDINAGALTTGPIYGCCTAGATATVGTIGY